MSSTENKINGFDFAKQYRDKYNSESDSEEKEQFKKLINEGKVMQDVVETIAEQVLLSVSANSYFTSEGDFPSDVARSMFNKAISYISEKYGQLQEWDKVKIRKSIYTTFTEDILKDLKWDLITFTDYDWQDLQGNYVGKSILDKVTLRETAFRKLNEWLLQNHKEECIKGIADLINKDNEEKVKKLEIEVRDLNSRILEIKNITGYASDY